MVQKKDTPVFDNLIQKMMDEPSINVTVSDVVSYLEK